MRHDSGAGRMTMQRFEDWTGARPWADAALAAWREATAPARQRAIVLTIDAVLQADGVAALMECFSSGRAFCFWQCSTVERVALRNAWEWRQWAVRSYDVTGMNGRFDPTNGT